MKLKLDESLTHRLQEPLRELGHDASTAAEEKLLGKPDPEFARAARREERMLFALDFHFADIRTYPPGQHPGIVVFRPASPGLQAIIHFVMDFVRRSDLRALAGCVVVVEPGRTRVRWPDPASG
ncbi:MAG: DUF5615 family PIN-like protein [Candidatus Acidiferrales bacterium]